jgi:hypothetical protein
MRHPPLSRLPFLALALLVGQLAAAETADPALMAAARDLRQRLAGDGAVAELVAPLAPQAVLDRAQANLGAIRQALREQAWDLAIRSARADGDCAVVVFEGRPGSRQAPIPFGTLYLIRDHGEWRLLPNASDYDRFFHRLDADQRRRYAALATWAKAEIPTAPARWSRGPGQIDSANAKEGMEVAFGQAITAGDAIVELVLPGLADSVILLEAGTIIRLTEEKKADGAEMVILLDQGTAQVDVRGLGSYQRIRVKGATLDIEVMGTLFVIQRLHRDQDYVALINGRLRVRDQSAKGQNQRAAIDLLPRQGVGGFASQGIGGIDQLLNRPQLIAGASLRDQGLASPGAYAQMVGAPAGGSSWSHDAAGGTSGSTSSSGSSGDGGTGAVTGSVTTGGLNTGAIAQTATDLGRLTKLVQHPAPPPP